VTHTVALDAPLAGTLEDATALLGGKAVNLGVMARDLGLPVPPGFVIGTAACRAFLATGWPADLDAELSVRMGDVEAAVGRRFGDAADPLLVSVRSGAPVSMPGMMDTILDLGLNDATTQGLAEASGSEPFARRCRERFESSFRTIVGVAEVPADPWDQLRLAIEAVFRSWNSDRARAYRQKERIPDELGTAVTVQAMVFGNRGAMSASGVVFTRDPSTGEPALYGDILFDAQGEDVVAGTHPTEPIAALDERLPTVAADLRRYATMLEHHFVDLCDIEFTIEEGRLWMLQVRVGKRSPQAALRIAVDLAQDDTFALSKAEAVMRVRGLLADPPTTTSARSGLVRPLITGLPASPGMATGAIVTNPEAAGAAAEAGRPAILVRAETSPDDVHGMARAAGILTSLGGLASHAAVVARGWGIPAVVGAAAMEVDDGCVVFGERTLEDGAIITIDGRTGEVFEGAIPGVSEVVPEARTLLAWARESDIEVGETPAGTDAAGPATVGPEPASPEPAGSDPSRGPAPARRIGPDQCLRALAIKGFASSQAVAEAVLSTPDDVEPILGQLAIDGLTGSVAGAHRLTESGSARAAALLEADRVAWGEDSAAAALDAFLELDHRVKETVTAWQLRDADAGVVNDHTDPAYDSAVLERLTALHADAAAWFGHAENGPPRLADYRVRLGLAVERAQAGDGRYLASPRVDSYHGIWFELHEDLIGLAGRTRADEAAAGRA
jgi:pyruvate, orthophosphate dikinase